MDTIQNSEWLPTKVMLIDDSMTIRLSVANMLKSEGCDVILAEDGLEGLLMAMTTVPDLIFLDLSMPVWSGFDVMAFLRSQPQTCQIPIIILSGRDGLMEKAKAMVLGADDFILKPCSRESITTAINLAVRH